LSIKGPLADCFGREHTDLRISVTDRCNVRCEYCMPAKGAEFRPHSEILTYEEIERFVRVAARLGICHVRITGGEPLVRKDIPRLVEMLSGIPGITDIAMTTNGILLDRFAGPLKAAGLDRLNISVDTLDRDKFQKITRHDKLPEVLQGIAAAREAGFENTKLNALAIRDFTEDEVAPLALFAREHGLNLRFIEFMPVDGDRRWTSDRVLPGTEILEILRREVGPLISEGRDGTRSPATEYRFRDGVGSIGVIHSVTQPFCADCNRLRLTADGRVRNCLFCDDHWDARALLRSGGSQRQLAQLIQLAVSAKRKIHGSRGGKLTQPDRAMHQIGG